MKTRIPVGRWGARWALVGIVGVLGFGEAAAADYGRYETLEAIHCVENPFNSTRPGRYGELGAYQFREATWKMHSREPFIRALERPVSDQVAIRHYEWLRRELRRHGLPVTTYNIAVAWNAGVTALVKGRAPRRAHDYARRVTNLAQDFSATQLAAAP
ncbi:MAG: hypothetical protein NVV63_16035 [Opitutus sp.]|nr:hypothetical protein [Opitutus sp.]